MIHDFDRILPDHVPVMLADYHRQLEQLRHEQLGLDARVKKIKDAIAEIHAHRPDLAPAAPAKAAGATRAASVN